MRSRNKPQNTSIHENNPHFISLKLFLRRICPKNSHHCFEVGKHWLRKLHGSNSSFQILNKKLLPLTVCVFHGSPSTPIDDLTFSVYLSNNETIETGIIGGENDPRIGTFVPAQQTLAVGGIAFNMASVAVNNPPYSSYKYIIVEVSYGAVLEWQPPPF